MRTHSLPLSSESAALSFPLAPWTTVLLWWNCKTETKGFVPFPGSICSQIKSVLSLGTLNFFSSFRCYVKKKKQTLEQSRWLGFFFMEISEGRRSNWNSSYSWGYYSGCLSFSSSLSPPREWGVEHLCYLTRVDCTYTQTCAYLSPQFLLDQISM